MFCCTTSSRWFFGRHESVWLSHLSSAKASDLKALEDNRQLQGASLFMQSAPACRVGRCEHSNNPFAYKRKRQGRRHLRKSEEWRTKPRIAVQVAIDFRAVLQTRGREVPVAASVRCPPSPPAINRVHPNLQRKWCGCRKTPTGSPW